jgi:hypothetical protein
VGCLGALLGLAMPRVVMVILWIFTDYLGRAYEGVIIPLLGFFFLPTTTLTYAIAENETGGFEGWGAVLIIVGVLFDLGIWGGGRGLFNRG